MLPSSGPALPRRIGRSTRALARVRRLSRASSAHCPHCCQSTCRLRIGNPRPRQVAITAHRRTHLPSGCGDLDTIPIARLSPAVQFNPASMRSRPAVTQPAACATSQNPLDSQEGREVFQDAGWAGGQPGWLAPICRAGRRRFRETGSMASKPMGRCRPKKIVGEHRDWLLKRCRGQTSPCEAWSASWPSVACRSITGRSGTSFTARSSLIKKDAGRQRA